jgi:hypothetical protein
VMLEIVQFVILRIPIRTSPKLLIMKISRWNAKLDKNFRSR